jgi:DNA-binding transcriptional MerR regulator
MVPVQEDEHVNDGLVTIGRFAALCRLSPKALRLYDDLGLLVPARTDPANGYRWYDPAQAGRARLVGLLRGLDMPLARISEALSLPGREAAALVRDHVDGATRDLDARRRLAAHVCLLLDEGSTPMPEQYDVKVRAVPQRAVLSGARRVRLPEADEVLGALLGRMRTSGPGLTGVNGCPHLVHHAEVSADSDGPVEVVRPMADVRTASDAAAALGDVQAALEPAHDEAFVVMTMAETLGRLHAPALAALERWIADEGRQAAGPPRQVMIADWRSAGPDDPACLFSVPLGPAG